MSFQFHGTFRLHQQDSTSSSSWLLLLLLLLLLFPTLYLCPRHIFRRTLPARQGIHLAPACSGSFTRRTWGGLEGRAAGSCGWRKRIWRTRTVPSGLTGKNIVENGGKFKKYKLWDALVQPTKKRGMNPPAVRARFNGGSELAWERAKARNKEIYCNGNYSKRHKKRDLDLPNVGKNCWNSTKNRPKLGRSWKIQVQMVKTWKGHERTIEIIQFPVFNSHATARSMAWQKHGTKCPNSAKQSLPYRLCTYKSCTSWYGRVFAQK